MLTEESGVERYISNNGDSSHSFGIYLFSFLGFSFTSLGFPFKKGVIKDYANFRPATYFIKKRFQHTCEICKIFKNTYSEEHVRTKIPRMRISAMLST